MPAITRGEVIAGKYRVERLLGRGTSGYVVAARHLALSELVAIKFLQKHALLDDTALVRFRREAKVCGRITSEYVAKVFDVGTHDEEPFLVMEYLEGTDLETSLKDGAVLSPAEACEHAMQVCEGLAEAHALGVVHRDVSLSNLFVTTAVSGAPLIKILDFGVSKLSLDAGDVTHTAAMVGSPKYMSPEQMDDPREVDARTDVWSLGVCLYRILSGRFPFVGETVGQLCKAMRASAPTRLLEVCPAAPPALSAVVAGCLQKDKALRFANVAELAAGLAPFAADVERAAARVDRISKVLGVPTPPLGGPPPRPAAAPLPSTPAVAAGRGLRRMRRHADALALGCGVLLLGATAVAVFRAIRPHSSEVPTFATSAPPPAQAGAPLPLDSADPALATTAPVATSTATTASASAAGPRRAHRRGAPRPDGSLPIPSDRK